MDLVTPVRKGAHVLLLNPPICDTAEAEEQDLLTCVPPFGLLRLATYFRQKGCSVDLLDCLRDPWLGGKPRRHVRKSLKCGNFEEEGISKPIYHFGLDEEQLASRLATLGEPDIVAISPLFTWQTEPCREAVRACRRVFDKARVILGGNVATLCPEEAAGIGADEVVAGDLPGAAFLPTADDLLPATEPTDCLRMVKGCPHECSYCVTKVLSGGQVTTRNAASVFAEMQGKLAGRDTRTFVFYDDFVLYQQSRLLDPFLDLVAAAGAPVNLEFALGFSAHMVDDAFAGRLRAAGVERVVLALETTSEARSRDMRRPQRMDEFVRAVRTLEEHGYGGHNLRAFYLIGLPGQTTVEILEAILFLFGLGVTPSLTTYALTPRSRDMERYRSQVEGRTLEELSPCLWRFAHSGMRVRDLDAIYRYFNERFYPLERVAGSPTSDPVIRMAQDLLRRGAHRPESW